MSENTKLIQPAKVRRDDGGFWFHPELPEFDEGEGYRARTWLHEQRLETHEEWLEYDDESPAYDAYFDRGEQAAEWNPKAPDGEGWFLLCIQDTEDGPVAVFVRRTQE